MSSRDDEPKSDLDDELGSRKRISFRDYPSTGVVVLAAIVSGLGWLVYKWSDGKRVGQSNAPKGPPQEAVSKASASDDENTSAEPKSSSS
ncbi:hypothetical protein AA309_08200 [Microvirga vignae]|uniref:Uncharacterized protein n=1 Tax=Microvirga vignae TaxID=1225564 RepID=A0A0H1REK3_9HYPH|nr:hypothetical protein AA309_08200 [Microvirga vignae]